MKSQFTAVYKKRSNWYLGWIEEVPGVNTQGKTMKECRKNLKEALFLVLETNRTIYQKESTSRGIIREPLFITR